jgi:hypothetical protein
MGDFNINETYTKHTYYYELEDALASCGVTRVKFDDPKTRTFYSTL